MMAERNPAVTRAAAGDADELSTIAHRAKRHWGYPPEWMALWRDELTVSPVMAASPGMFIIRSDGRIWGWCALTLAPPVAEVTGCWVLPEFMGRGVGTRLLDHALSHAKAAGIHVVTVLSDPHAEEFYRRFGFRRAELAPSVPAGRKLPLMHLRLERKHFDLP